MGWLDSQIKERKKYDDENYEKVFSEIAGAVMGEKLRSSMDDEEIVSSAIAKVLDYYHISQAEMEIPLSVKTLQEKIEYVMRPHGVMHREVKLTKGWRKLATGPMLGTLKATGDAVALIPYPLGGYAYYNLATDKSVRITGKIEDEIDEEATCFYKPLPIRKMNLKDLGVFLIQQLNAIDFVYYFLMLGITTAIGMVAPMLTKLLFGEVLESRNYMMLIAIAIFMLSYLLCSQLMKIMSSFINNRITTKISLAVDAAAMQRALSLPASFYRDYSAGDLSMRVGYVKQLSNMMVGMATSLFSAVFSLVYIAQIFNFAPSLALPAIIFTLLNIGFSLVLSASQMKLSKKQMTYSTAESSLTYSTLNGMQKIKVAGAEKRMFTRWAKLYTRMAAIQYNPPAFIKYGKVIGMAIPLLGTIVMYFVAVQNAVAVDDYYAFNASYAMVSGAFMSLAGIVSSITTIKPVYEMAKPIFDAEPEVSDGKEIVTHLRGGIEINSLSFRYDPDMPFVLDNLNLKIKPGEYVAIVGSTGCGKSTLVRLLLGFEIAERGSILFDGKDIRGLDLKSLRKKIGTVMQDGKLFTGDIYSNIVISAPQLTVSDAWEAAEKAALADDIRKMPMEMHTFISEGQGGISGGQKQRLLIARALAPKPKILIFDEATSALDNITQKKVSEAIDELRCTRIVIAHRLSTIRRCSRIIVLDAGKIKEEGTYEELIAKKGLFAELVERQRIDVSTENE